MKNTNTNQIKNIYVFTDEANGLNNTAFWCWLMTSEDKMGNSYKNQFGELEITKSELGMKTFCECSNCQIYQKEIPMFFAVSEALKWMLVDENGFKMNVIVNSELLSLAKNNPEQFCQKVEESEGCELKCLGSQIINLLNILDVEITNTDFKSKGLSRKTVAAGLKKMNI